MALRTRTGRGVPGVSQVRSLQPQGSSWTGPAGAELGGRVWVESSWCVRLGGLQKGSPWWFLPRDRHRSPARERTSRAGSAREPGAHAEGV